MIVDFYSYRVECNYYVLCNSQMFIYHFFSIIILVNAEDCMQSPAFNDNWNLSGFVRKYICDCTEYILFEINKTWTSAYKKITDTGFQEINQPSSFLEQKSLFP